MSFAERFKGKVALIGKEGVISSLDSHIQANDATNPHLITKSLSQLPPKPQKSTNQNISIFKTNAHKNDSYSLDRPLPKRIVSSSKYQAINPVEPPLLKTTEDKQKSNLQKLGYNYIYQPYDNSAPKYFPTAPNTNLSSQLSSKGMANNRQNMPASLQNETEYNEKIYGYKPYTIHDYQNIKREKYKEMGGLGPNIGGEDWKEKMKSRKEMLQFGSKISEYNREKLLVLPKRTNSPLRRESKRDKAMEYAKKLSQMMHDSIPILNYTEQLENDLSKLHEQRINLSDKIEKIKKSL